MASWCLQLFHDGGPYHIETYISDDINLPCKSKDWFLYNRGLLHERVKDRFSFIQKREKSHCVIENAEH